MTITERLNHRTSLYQLDQEMGGDGSVSRSSLSTYLSLFGVAGAAVGFVDMEGGGAGPGRRSCLGISEERETIPMVSGG